MAIHSIAIIAILALHNSLRTLKLQSHAKLYCLMWITITILNLSQPASAYAQHDNFKRETRVQLAKRGKVSQLLF